MISGLDLPSKLIWATRGRSWGFRFLLDAGFSDPLPEYEAAFQGLENEPTAWRRGSEYVALRLADPLSRRDAAGRVIPHDFVIFGDLANSIASAEDGALKIWPLVAGTYARIWDADEPPSLLGLRSDG